MRTGAGVEHEDHHAFDLRIEVGMAGDVRAPVGGRLVGGVARIHLVRGGAFVERNNFVLVGLSRESERFDQGIHLDGFWSEDPQPCGLGRRRRLAVTGRRAVGVPRKQRSRRRRQPTWRAHLRVNRRRQLMMTLPDWMLAYEAPERDMSSGQRVDRCACR